MAEHNQPIDRPREAPEAALDRRFLRLHEHYERQVNLFFVHRGFTEEECRDLTQDTFLRVFQNIESLRDADAERRWLFKVATNIYRNEIRHRQAGKRRAKVVSLEGETERGREFQVSALRSAAPERQPLDHALASEAQRLLREGLDELPPRMRRCVKLRLGHDLSYEEIATLMQVTSATVKVQLHQARRRLREKLGDHFHDLEL